MKNEIIKIRGALESGLEYCEMVKLLSERMTLTMEQMVKVDKIINAIREITYLKDGFATISNDEKLDQFWKKLEPEMKLKTHMLLQACTKIRDMVRWIPSQAERYDLYLKYFGIELDNPEEILYDEKYENIYKLVTFKRPTRADHDITEESGFPVTFGYQDIMRQLQQMYARYPYCYAIQIQDIEVINRISYLYCGKIYNKRRI